jgi:hypothetical protein
VCCYLLSFLCLLSLVCWLGGGGGQYTSGWACVTPHCHDAPGDPGCPPEQPLWPKAQAPRPWRRCRSLQSRWTAGQGSGQGRAETRMGEDRKGGRAAASSATTAAPHAPATLPPHPTSVSSASPYTHRCTHAHPHHPPAHPHLHAQPPTHPPTNLVNAQRAAQQLHDACVRRHLAPHPHLHQVPRHQLCACGSGARAAGERWGGQEDGWHAAAARREGRQPACDASVHGTAIAAAGERPCGRVAHPSLAVRSIARPAARLPHRPHTPSAPRSPFPRWFP